MKGHRWFAALFDPLNRITGMETKFLAKCRPNIAGEATGQVLEVGAGTGANLPYFSKADKVIATEPDTFMLERARQHLAELSADNIELRQCPVSVPNKALAEIRRVLKPSGTFRFIEHVRPEGGLKARIFDAITPIWSWFGAGCHPNRRTLESIEQAGFEVEKLERVTHSGMPVIIGLAVPVDSAKKDS